MSGGLAVPADVGWVDDGDVVTVARFGTGQRVVLAGTAAVVWRLAVETADRAAVVRRAQAHFDSDPAEVAAGVEGALAELVDQELLVSLGAAG